MPRGQFWFDFFPLFLQALITLASYCLVITSQRPQPQSGKIQPEIPRSSFGMAFSMRPTLLAGMPQDGLPNVKTPYVKVR
jgi:hypothetical protein